MTDERDDDEGLMPDGSCVPWDERLRMVGGLRVPRLSPEEQAGHDLKLLHLRQAIESGATLSDFIGVYGAIGDNGATEAEIAEACERYCAGSDNELEIDSPTLTSRGDDGLWVLGWFFLARHEVTLDDAISEFETAPSLESANQLREKARQYGEDEMIGEQERDFLVASTAAFPE